MTEPGAYDPTRAAAAALLEARRLARETPGDPWEWNAAHFDRLAGTDQMRQLVEEGWQLNKLTERWSTELEAFELLRAPNLLYP
jgi:hypothetical protein